MPDPLNSCSYPTGFTDLCPDLYDFDMIACAQEFFELFWNYSLSFEEASELLANPTLIRS